MKTELADAILGKGQSNLESAASSKVQALLANV